MIWKVTMHKIELFNPKFKGKTPAKYYFKDSDGDNVINMFDCEPLNKRKQGFQHQPIHPTTPLPGVINPTMNQIVRPEITKYAIPANSPIKQRMRRALGPQSAPQ